MKIKVHTVRPKWFKGMVNKNNMAHYAKNNPNNVDVLNTQVAKWRTLCYIMFSFLCIQSAVLWAFIFLGDFK